MTVRDSPPTDTRSAFERWTDETATLAGPATWRPAERDVAAGRQQMPDRSGGRARSGETRRGRRDGDAAADGPVPAGPTQEER